MDFATFDSIIPKTNFVEHYVNVNKAWNGGSDDLCIIERTQSDGCKHVDVAHCSASSCLHPFSKIKKEHGPIQRILYCCCCCCCKGNDSQGSHCIHTMNMTIHFFSIMIYKEPRQKWTQTSENKETRVHKQPSKEKRTPIWHVKVTPTCQQ